ncbi:recombinase family protein, partial [Escherichia coli]
THRYHYDSQHRLVHYTRTQYEEPLVESRYLYSDMCAVTTRLRDQGVTLIFLKEQLTFSAGTNNPMQELQLHMMSAFSQFERALLKERQADGIAAKKARGEKTGRPGADIKKIQEIDALRSRGVRLRIACDHAGLGVSTYYKLRHQMNNQ